MAAISYNPGLFFPWEKETDLEFCIVYDPSLSWPDHPAFEVLVDEVYQIAAIDKLIEAKSPKAVANAHMRRRTELASLLWHLYLVHINQGIAEDAPVSKSKLTKQHQGLFDDEYLQHHKFPYVRISLNKNDYKIADPSNPFRITVEVSNVLNRLEAAGQIEKQPGFNNADGSINNPSRQTRFRPDSPLETMFNALPPITTAPPRPQKPTPDVFKHARKNARTGTAKPVWDAFEFYPICPTLNANSYLIDQYNDFISKSKIRVAGARSGYLIEAIGNGELRFLPTSNIFLQNQYHVLDDGHITYGRMHGGFWQNMKSQSRHLIRIDGEDVVIFDYKGMILNIAAVRHDVQLPNDPYEIDFGLGDKGKALQRKLVKQTVIIAINSLSRTEVYRAMRQEFKNPFADAYGLVFKKDVVDAIVNALMAAYPFLDQVFLKKIGKDIFMQDAEIARDIMRRFLNADKLVLPIHDGFVAKRSDRDFLMQSMMAAWRDRFSTDITIDEE